MVQIHRNVGGIEGLHLATDCFTEEVERRIFTSIDESGYQSGKRSHGGQPTGLVRWPYDWPTDYIKLVNLIRDVGLLPNYYVPPDYCLRLMYPPKAGFQFHHDSKYRWGEVIVGVNLGQEGIMMFTPDNREDAFDEAAFASEYASKLAGVNKSMKVKLPRRSVYVMSGPSRYVYKHGIAQQKPTEVPPSWNTLNMRKSLTFRSTKVFSDEYLERQLAAEQHTLDAATTTTRMEWQARKEAQNKYKPRGTKAEVAQERQNATALLNMMDSGIIPAQLRFGRSEVTFDLPPGVVERTSSGNIGSMFDYGSIFGGGVGNVGVASVPPAAAAAAAFHGEGRKLGSSSANHSGVGNDDDMQMAMNASLRSLAEERTARAEKKRKRKSGCGGSDEGASESYEASPKKGGVGTGASGGVIDLVGEEEEEEDKKKCQNSSDAIVIHD